MTTTEYVTTWPYAYGPAVTIALATERSVWRMKTCAVVVAVYGPSALPAAPLLSSPTTVTVLMWAKVPVVAGVASDASGIAW